MRNHRRENQVLKQLVNGDHGLENQVQVRRPIWRSCGLRRHGRQRSQRRKCRQDHLLRLHQQRCDTSGVKKEKCNAVSLKNPDYCARCFKNTGKKWNNHSEATCNNKKRTEGGGGGGGGGDGGGGKIRGRYACQSTEHVAKDCLVLAKVRAMMATESQIGRASCRERV